MEAWQERVLDEKEELDLKRCALNTFLESDKFATLDEKQIGYLIRQSVFMESYSNILHDRVADFS